MAYNHEGEAIDEISELIQKTKRKAQMREANVSARLQQ